MSAVQGLIEAGVPAADIAGAGLILAAVAAWIVFEAVAEACHRWDKRCGR